jgi:nitric oxide reductase NorD protein
MRRRRNGARRLALKIRLGGASVRESIQTRLAAWRPVVTLEEVQRRLELFIAALYGAPIPIVPNTQNASTWLDRASRAMNAADAAVAATPATDGASIRLPREMRAGEGAGAALARYRLFAVEQAERILRGTAALAASNDPIVRDLYLVKEASAIDARIARDQPGLRPLLERERAAALAARPRQVSLTKRERAVESIVRESLSSDPALAQAGDPHDSLDWARETADLVRRLPGGYRGIRPTQVWGAVTESLGSDWRREASHPIENIVMRKYLWGRTEADSEDSTGRTTAAAEKYSENKDASSVPDTRQRADARRRGNASAAPSGQTTLDRPDLEGLPPAIWYDEWDADAGAYAKRKAGVRISPPASAVDEARVWADRAIREHAALERKVRHQFERLRARRTLLPRQRSGDEIDLAAMVGALTDRQMGQGGNDRLYMAARPARRGLAIGLLADVSGSTKAQVSDGRRIIDLEKVALLLATTALDALGDRYAAYAFAGQSPENVSLTVLKEFAERSGAETRRRIGALAPGGFTRLGAAVRYVTAQLAAESAGHRLLLLLSDGRPNDVDRYQSEYGVEDSRQAIVEARASGVYPYCLTIDANASEYLPRIFGATGYAVVTKAEQLPTAMVAVVRGVVRRG